MIISAYPLAFLSLDLYMTEQQQNRPRGAAFLGPPSGFFYEAFVEVEKAPEETALVYGGFASFLLFFIAY